MTALTLAVLWFGFVYHMHNTRANPFGVITSWAEFIEEALTVANVIALPFIIIGLVVLA